MTTKINKEETRRDCQIAPIIHYPGGWHKQHCKECICIWSDKWLENLKKQTKTDNNDCKKS